MVEQIAQRATAEKILLLNRCLTISATASPAIGNKIALNPGGVDVTVSTKTPNITPETAAVSSEQNIHIGTNKARKSKGFACAILMLKTPLYWMHNNKIKITAFISLSFKILFWLFIGLITTLGLYAALSFKIGNYHNGTNLINFRKGLYFGINCIVFFVDANVGYGTYK